MKNGKTGEGSYLLLVTERGKSFRSIKDQIKSNGGYWVENGYAFPLSSYDFLEEIKKTIPNAKVVSTPFPEDISSFEAFLSMSKVSSLYAKIIKKKEEISRFLNDRDLETVSIEHLDGLLLPETEKEYIAQLLQEKEKLEEELKFDIGLQVYSKKSQTKAPKIEIKSIAEISPTYFSDKPTEKPVLLSYTEKGDPSCKKLPFLHKEITAMIVAEGGVGKTHLLAHLAMCVASGVPFLGHFKVDNPGAVCLILGENSPQDVHRLLYKSRTQIEEMLEENEKTEDCKRFMTDGNELLKIEKQIYPISVHGIDASLIDKFGNPTEFADELLDKLKKTEPEDGFQLIIFDPASRFAGPTSEKDNAIATAFISQSEWISGNLSGKPTIFLSHHKNKAATKESGGQTDARGSSALVDGARWMATLTHPDKKEKFLLHLEIHKTNFTAIPRTIKIKKDLYGLMNFKDFENEKK